MIDPLPDPYGQSSMTYAGCGFASCDRPDCGLMIDGDRLPPPPDPDGWPTAVILIFTVLVALAIAFAVSHTLIHAG